MNSYDLGDLKFLIVDPNPFGRNLMRWILRSLGARNLEMAKDGDSGLVALGAYSPDIVFSEWFMDPTDGLEFTRRVRTSGNTPDPFVAIVMMTAQTEANHVIQARDAGITEFLAKPLAVQSVYSRICAMIEHPRDFIRSKPYFGPDRRRHDDPNYRGPWLREADKFAAVDVEADPTAQGEAAVRAQARTTLAKGEKAFRNKSVKRIRAEPLVGPVRMPRGKLAAKPRGKDFRQQQAGA
jgi:two-component system, chemotaxis family, chemotaxis protein CheY